jgi:hypothetical protein
LYGTADSEIILTFIILLAPLAVVTEPIGSKWLILLSENQI